ncbi:MAG: bile acid:sodium symporter family protein, partial [Gammaproteobacteria bacterium]|nr:bile acid:sodium symporter family protein [Gammaproteobacteria bacterium]
MQRFMQFFPLWAILLSAIAYLFPTLFTPLKPGIVPLLMVIMFGMGITLTFGDFLRVLRQPGILLLGVTLQYSIMPLAALLVARMLDLPTALLVGMVLLGSSPGGTASNVICYLARGNVALSVTLTLLSTLLAFVLTPALTWLYVGHAVPVPVWDMLYSVLKIVVIPVLLGAMINTLVGNRTG